MGWWVVVGGYGQGPQSMTGTDGVAPVRARGAPTGAIVCNSVQDQGAFSCSLDSTQLGTQCDVMQSSTTQCVKAGEGDRTLDIQLGKLTNSPVSSLSGAKRSAGESAQNQNDPHLAMIVAAWPALSDSMKAGIVAMVVASTKNK